MIAYLQIWQPPPNLFSWVDGRSHKGQLHETCQGAQDAGHLPAPRQQRAYKCVLCSSALLRLCRVFPQRKFCHLRVGPNTSLKQNQVCALGTNQKKTYRNFTSIIISFFQGCEYDNSSFWKRNIVHREEYGR